MLEARTKGRTSKKAFSEAVHAVLAEVIAEVKPVVFGGNGYAEAWHEEAKRRGLLNLPTTLDALDTLISDKNRALFTRYAVLSERELESRHEVLVDQYFKTVNIEGETSERIARTMLLPAAIRYLGMLVGTLESADEIDMKLPGVKDAAEEASDAVDALRKAVKKLSKQNEALGGETVEEKAHHMRDHVLPAMADVRAAADALERIVPHDRWPLPSYQDILFAR